MAMTKRERVWAALAHEQPDVAPWQIDLTIDARLNTAAYLGDPDFEGAIGNHLAGCEAAGKLVMQHSCGAVQELSPNLIDIGLDIFSTFRPEVMNVGHVKREYGRHLTFYGGISTQQVLPRVGPAEVRAEVRRMIARIGAGGGCIVAPTHAIPRDVPPENIVAFIEAVQGQ